MNKEPLSHPFNIAVWTIANTLHPLGWDVSSEAPSTYEDLVKDVAKRGRFTVWNGASDETIYADPETNFAFRAWHDWVHWRYNLDFSPANERAVAYVQAAHLLRTYGKEWQTNDFVALILAEVIGQAEYKDHFGDFPHFQVDFVREAAKEFSALAYTLCNLLDGKSDRAAIRLAKKHAGIKHLAPRGRALQAVFQAPLKRAA